MTKLVPISALILLLAACGEGPPATTSSETSGAAATNAVEVQGNITQASAKGGKLLVFLYANLPPNVTPAAAEPTSIGGIGPDRTFSFTNAPPGNLTVLFLVDNGNDGAIDPGDPIGLLSDPEHHLSGLQAGDQVLVKDITVDVANGTASAASIEVKHLGAPATAPPASPSPQ